MVWAAEPPAQDDEPTWEGSLTPSERLDPSELDAPPPPETPAPSKPAPDGGAEAEEVKEATSQTNASLIGNLRLVGGFLRFPDAPALYPERNDGILSLVGRVIGTKQFGDTVDVEVNAFGNMTRAPAGTGSLGGTFATAGSFNTPYRSPVMSLESRGSSSVTSRFGLDRARIGVHAKRLALDIGRFPVNYSVAHILTPNDFFAPFSATAINTAYKAGVDAVRGSIALPKLSTIEVLYVSGWGDGEVPAPSWGRTALLARASVVLWDFEWAVLGGKLAERWMVGGSFQGEAGPVGLHGEAHVGFPDRDGFGFDPHDESAHVRLSAGPSLSLAWHNTTISAEYAYFSDGARHPSDIVQKYAQRFPDDLPYVGRHYAGAIAGLDVTPLLRATMLSLVDASDGSGLVGASLSYSIADEAQLLFGGYLPWGKTPRVNGDVLDIRSEFGLVPRTLYAEARVYF
jgi:hypothetical protein